MKTFNALAAIAAGATLLTSAASASATVLIATWTGTVSSGYDTTGIFGAAGTSLTGDSYVATYTYDTSVGTRLTSLPSFDEVIGGSGDGNASPVSATIKISGHTATVYGNNEGFAVTAPYQGGHVYIQNSAYDRYLIPGGYTDSLLYNYVIGFNLPAIQANLETPVPLTTLTGFNQEGHVEFVTYYLGVGYTMNTYADLGPATLQISNAGVPEPSAWALMLTGFGVAGAAVRGRRRARRAGVA